MGVMDSEEKVAVASSGGRARTQLCFTEEEEDTESFTCWQCTNYVSKMGKKTELCTISNLLTQDPSGY